MVPNFALALSFEGITLLRRTGQSWARIEEVPIDHADLDAAVIAMRDRAEALDPKGANVAVVIPNEQIRYLELPDLGGDDTARDVAIRAALDGATPYPVSDLRTDHVQTAGRLKIAAVAQETLDEAETFARDHGFTPVCHMARAPEGRFDGPVFFGPASSWKRAVSRPQRAMQIVAADEAALQPVPAPAKPTHAQGDGAALTDATAPGPVAPAAPETASPADPVPPANAAKAQPAKRFTSLAPHKPSTPTQPAAPMATPDATEKPGQIVQPAEQSVPFETALRLAAAASPSPAAIDAADKPAKPLLPPRETPAEASPPPKDPDAPPLMAFSTVRANRESGKIAPAPKPVLSPREEGKPRRLKARFTPVAEKEMATRDAGITSDQLDEAPEDVKPTAVPFGRALSAPKNDDLAAKAPGAPRLPTDARQPSVEKSSSENTLSEQAPPKPTLEPKKPALGRLARQQDKAQTNVAPKKAQPGSLSATPSPAAPSAAPPVAAPSTPPPPKAQLTAPAEGKPRKLRKGGKRKRRAPDVAPAAQGAAPRVVSPADTGHGAPSVTRPNLATPASNAPSIAARDAAPASVPVPKPAAGNPNPLARLAALRDAKPAAQSEAVAKPALAGSAAARPAKKSLLNPRDERERMTVFGARQEQQIGGKPRFLGLMLTSFLLLFLAGVAAWASVFLEDGLARLFRSEEPATAIATAPVIESTPVALSTPDAASPAVSTSLTPVARPASPQQDGAAPSVASGLSPTLSAPDAEEQADIQLAALETPPPATDAAGPMLNVPIVPRALSPEEAQTTYAATGFWLRAPNAPRLPPIDAVDQIYVVSLDPSIKIFDAVALPDPGPMFEEPILSEPGLPPPAGLTFDIDERGVVRATPEGALTPDGLRVYAGLPPVVPPLRGRSEDPVTADDPAAPNPLQLFRPEARPNDIIEQRERATLRGISRQELEAFRPVQRPRTAQEDAELAEPDARATDQAVRASLVPVGRPRDMASIVSRTEEERPTQPIQTAAAAAIVPQSVQPNVPSSANVAQAATVRNAINLNKISLIGVYGTPANRRALVRLASGKYLKVKVGDELDGGRVAAIGEDDLRYLKRGRNVTLKMPRG